MSFSEINCTILRGMFENCISLISLENIEYLKLCKIIDTSKMFYNCSLSSLPDISQWETDDVTDMSEMFAYCSSLTS